MKQSAVYRSGVMPDSKQACGDNLNMAASSPPNKVSIQEEIKESDMANLILKTFTIFLKTSKEL